MYALRLCLVAGAEAKRAAKKAKAKPAKKASTETPLGIKLEGTQNTSERVEKLRGALNLPLHA